MHRALSLSISPFVDPIRPLLCAAAALLLAAGITLGITAVPAVPVEAASFRIAVLHYPAEWTSFMLYVATALLSAVTLARHERAAAVLANAIPPTGMLFTLIALWTEALWRKPVQGLWWVWDAEAVAQLMLMFLFGGLAALRAMIDDPRRADRAAALLALVGAANLPVLYFSIRWWDALHRGPVIPAAPAMGALLAIGCALVAGGFMAYALFAVLGRARCTVAERRALARSTRELVEARS